MTQRAEQTSPGDSGTSSGSPVPVPADPADIPRPLHLVAEAHLSGTTATDSLREPSYGSCPLVQRADAQQPPPWRDVASTSATGAADLDIGTSALTAAAPVGIQALRELGSRQTPDGLRQGAWYRDGLLLLFGSDWVMSLDVRAASSRARLFVVGSSDCLELDPDSTNEQPDPIVTDTRWWGGRQLPPLAAGWLTADRSPLLPFSAAEVAHNELCAATAAILEDISPRARRLLEQFPQAQWSMLRFLANGGPACADLCEGNPALAFLLARADAFVGHGGVTSRRFDLALAKQTWILARLRFPRPTTSVVRLLKKFAPSELSIPTLEKFRRLTGCRRAVRQLAHLPHLNDAVVDAFPAVPDMVPLGTGLLHRLCVSGSRTQAHRVRRTCEMLHQARRLGYACPDHLPTLSVAMRHYSALRRLLRSVRGIRADAPFPDYPLPGVAGSIEPIRTAGELIAEADELHHCAFSYLHAAMAGNIAFYRVLEPRLTMALVPHRGGWALHDARGLLDEEDMGLEAAVRLSRWLGDSGVMHRFSASVWQIGYAHDPLEVTDDDVPF